MTGPAAAVVARRDRSNDGSNDRSNALFEALKGRPGASGDAEQVRAVLRLSRELHTEPARCRVVFLQCLLLLAGIPEHACLLADLDPERPPAAVLDGVVAAVDLKRLTLPQAAPLLGRSRNRAACRVRRFFELLGSELGLNSISGPFVSDLLPAMLSMACHKVRVFRHVGTVSALYFVDGLLTQVISSQRDSRRFSEQAARETGGLSANFGAKAVEAAECAGTLLKLVDVVATAVVLTRWRDRSDDVRLETVAALHRWVARLPAVVVANPPRCRVLTWALDDKATHIRLAATAGLRDMFSAPGAAADVLPPLREECEGSPSPLRAMASRLLDLVWDGDFAVGAAAVEALQPLLEAGDLRDEEVDSLVELVWHVPSLVDPEASAQCAGTHASRATRRGARGAGAGEANSEGVRAYRDAVARFVDSAIFSTSIIDAGSSSDGQKQMLDLRAILEFLVEFAPEAWPLLDRFVSAFWRKSTALRRPEVLVEILTVTESAESLENVQPLHGKYLLPATTLLLFIFLHLKWESEGGESGAAGREGEGASDGSSAALAAMHAALQIVLKSPQLLRISKSNESAELTVAVLLQLATAKLAEDAPGGAAPDLGAFPSLAEAGARIEAAFLTCNHDRSLAPLGAAAATLRAVAAAAGAGGAAADDARFRSAVVGRFCAEPASLLALKRLTVLLRTTCIEDASFFEEGDAGGGGEAALQRALAGVGGAGADPAAAAYAAQCQLLLLCNLSRLIGLELEQLAGTAGGAAGGAGDFAGFGFGGSRLSSVDGALDAVLEAVELGPGALRRSTTYNSPPPRASPGRGSRVAALAAKYAARHRAAAAQALALLAAPDGAGPAAKFAAAAAFLEGRRLLCATYRSLSRGSTAAASAAAALAELLPLPEESARTLLRHFKSVLAGCEILFEQLQPPGAAAAAAAAGAAAAAAAAAAAGGQLTLADDGFAYERMCAEKGVAAAGGEEIGRRIRAEQLLFHLRQLQTSEDACLLGCGVLPLFLALLANDRAPEPLAAAVEDLVDALCCCGAEKALVWNVVLKTVLVFCRDAARRGRLRTLARRLAKALPESFVVASEHVLPSFVVELVNMADLKHDGVRSAIRYALQTLLPPALLRPEASIAELALQRHAGALTEDGTSLLQSLTAAA